MKILVSIGAGMVKDSFFTPQVIERLETIGTVVYNETGNQEFTKQELIDHIVDVDVLFSGWGTPTIDSEVLQYANNLKIHAHTGGSVASYISKEE